MYIVLPMDIPKMFHIGLFCRSGRGILIFASPVLHKFFRYRTEHPFIYSPALSYLWWNFVISSNIVQNSSCSYLKYKTRFASPQLLVCFHRNPRRNFPNIKPSKRPFSQPQLTVIHDVALLYLQPGLDERERIQRTSNGERAEHRQRKELSLVHHVPFDSLYELGRRCLAHRRHGLAVAPGRYCPSPRILGVGHHYFVFS